MRSGVLWSCAGAIHRLGREGAMKSIYYKSCEITQQNGYVTIRFQDGSGWNADTVQEAKHEIDQYEEREALEQ